ncbi:hypothetical protein EDB19DRAFT_2044912 [Suillus lakei]|nr:hypothetical protein EDB19DRAFT_2044912 [Suillus lakei]
MFTETRKSMGGISSPLHSGTHPVPTPDSLRQVDTEKGAIIRVLRPLAVQQVAKGSSSTAANRIIQTGIATIIVLEYSAFLPNDNSDKLKHVRSAVDYYLKSPKAVAAETVAKEISSQGYKKEELGKKILEFILENHMSNDLAEQK